MNSTPVQAKVTLGCLLLSAVWLGLDYQLKLTVLAQSGVIAALSSSYALILIPTILCFLWVRHLCIRLAGFKAEIANPISAKVSAGFGATLLISALLGSLELSHTVEHKRNHALSLASSQAQNLAKLIQQSQSATTALAYLVSQNPDNLAQLDFAARELLQTSPGITNLQLAPDGVVSTIIPLEGHEKALGHNLLADPNRQKEAFLALETGQLTLAGPFKLVQGGTAVIARRPVFIDSEFWGFTSALMLLDQLIDESRLKQIVKNDYAWTLHRTHPDTKQRHQFAASSAALKHNPVTHSFQVPNGRWTLSLAPADSWLDTEYLLMYCFLVALSTTLASLFVFNTLRYPVRLEQLLELRTRHLEQKRSFLKQAQQQLAESQERLELAIKGADLGLWEANPATGEARFSTTWATMLGYQPGSLRPSVEQWKNLLHPDDRQSALDQLNAYLNGEQELYEADIRMRTADGDWRWIHTQGKLYERDADGQPTRMLGIHQDIHTRKELEIKLKTLSEAVEHSPVATVITDTRPEILYVNPQFSRQTGYNADEVIGQNPKILQSGKTPLDEYQRLWKTITAKKVWRGELWNRKKDGELALESIAISPVINERDTITHYVATKLDITQQREMEQTIWHQANFDLLTGLCNRFHFIERAELAIARAQRQQQRVLILFIDLDQFKPINDTYGHKAGDLVLQEFARRLKHSIRESDTAARLGGDEFVALIDTLAQEQSIEAILEHLVQALTAEPYQLDPQSCGLSSATTVTVGASMGYSIYPDHGEDLNQLLNQADTMMYQNKAENASPQVSRDTLTPGERS